MSPSVIHGSFHARLEMEWIPPRTPSGDSMEQYLVRGGIIGALNQMITLQAILEQAYPAPLHTPMICISQALSIIATTIERKQVALQHLAHSKERKST